MKRKTTEEFIAEASIVHNYKYYYNLCDYVNSEVKVQIICSDHGIFHQLPSAHLRGQGCTKCAGRLIANTSEFIYKSLAVHNSKYTYSRTSYVSNNFKVVVTCNKHGDFSITPSNHLKGRGCPKCAGKRRTTYEFIEQAHKTHGNLYSYTNTVYSGSSKKLLVTCSIHGDFAQLPGWHLCGVGCPKCAGKNKTDSEFVEQAEKIHSNLYIYDSFKYGGDKSKSIITCRIHGDFLQSAGSHLQGRGCPKCAKTGFDPAKPAVFYVYTFRTFVGFGISNDFKSRNTQHQLNFKKKCVDATLIATYNMSGESALELERYIKQTLPIINAGIDGFKTEAVHIDNIHLLLTTVKENLK